MGGIVTWFVDKLLAALEGYLHPEQAARWAEIEKQGKDLDAARMLLDRKEVEFQGRLAASAELQVEWQVRIDGLNQAIAENEKAFDALTEKRKQIADDLAKTETDIDARPDTDRIEQPLPGTAGDGR